MGNQTLVFMPLLDHLGDVVFAVVARADARDLHLFPRDDLGLPSQSRLRPPQNPRPAHRARTAPEVSASEGERTKLVTIAILASAPGGFGDVRPGLGDADLGAPLPRVARPSTLVFLA